MIGWSSDRYCSTVTTPVAGLIEIAKAASPLKAPPLTTPTITPPCMTRLIALPSVTCSPDEALVMLSA